MAEKIIWQGSSTFYTGSTPFQFYDTDTQFQTDADKVANFVASRLGYPMMDVELTPENIYTCFEEAVTTYGNEVFQYKIRENYLSLEGGSTSISANTTLINPNLSRIVGISKAYGTEAEVGGNYTKHSGSVNVQEGVQAYDLDKWATDNGITGGIEIRKVFYESPPAILRYFDPYAGTGTGIQSLMDAFDFGSYSPGVNFLLMPASFDMLKIQAIEFNDQIRKSAFSFELNNNILKIFPIPKASGKMWFEYYKLEDKQSIGSSSTTAGGDTLITNVGEVPYENPNYTKINSVGRQWIFKYTLALAREVLGDVRAKYSTVPVPGSEVTLNGAALVQAAQNEQQLLLTNLREMLDQTSRQVQLEKKAQEADNMNKTLNSVPMTIYIG